MAESEDTTITNPLPTDTAELVDLLVSQQLVIEVCQKLRDLIDPTDDCYVVQKELASCGVIPALFDLLSSENDEEIVTVCDTISTLCANIEGVSTRKRSGLETGFQETSFNPVQNELAEVEGIRKLVNLLKSPPTEVPNAANECLWTCCSFNHLNTVACLQCLVHDVLEHKDEVLEYLNSFLLDIEVREDVKVLLDLLIMPVLTIVRNEQSSFRKDAMISLGILCERHPVATNVLCEQGAIQPVVQIVLQDKSQRGRGVHVLWHLVRQNKDMLKPTRGKLGVSGTALIEPLMAEIGRDKQSSNPDGEQADQAEDYSDEALLVLKALAEQDEEVREKVGDLIESDKSLCSVM